MRQQAAQQFAERLAHGVAGAVGLFHQVGDFFAEREAVQRGAQFAHRRRDQGYVADRLLHRGAAHFHFPRLMVRAEDPGVVDLGEIVILGGQPEDRHRGQSVVGQPCGQLHRVQDFVNGVARAGKQSHLLAGHHGDGPGCARRSSAGLSGFCTRNASISAARRSAENSICRGGGLKRFQSAQGMLVKRGGSVGMIQYVREQARGVGQIALADAGTVHAWISLTDERAVAKDSTHLGVFQPAGRILEMSL